MFVSVKSKVKLASLSMGLVIMSSASAIASDAPAWKSVPGDIPITLELSNIAASAGPIYVSIQKRDQYMSMKGHGGIIKTVTAGAMQATFNVDAPDEYAVSIWHDMDDDGRFSMDETYRITDGWGASGTPPKMSKPTFDDVKIDVPAQGRSVAIEMINAN